SYSTDNGATWHQVGAGRGPSVPSSPTLRVADQAAELDEALSKYRQEISLRQDLTEENRRDLIRQAESLVGAYKEQNSGDTQPKPEAKPPAKPHAEDPAPAKPGVTRDTSLAWDTSQVPDGIYLLRVVASDRPSNPSESLTAEKVSGPVIVCNQPPIVFVMVPAIQYGSDRRATVTGLCQTRVTLKGAQYRVDEGEWNAIDAADGIWDSGMEQWRLVTDPLAPGDHTLQVKAVDAAGNI